MVEPVTTLIIAGSVIVAGFVVTVTAAAAHLAILWRKVVDAKAEEEKAIKKSWEVITNNPYRYVGQVAPPSAQVTPSTTRRVVQATAKPGVGILPNLAAPAAEKLAAQTILSTVEGESKVVSNATSPPPVRPPVSFSAVYALALTGILQPTPRKLRASFLEPISPRHA